VQSGGGWSNEGTLMASNGGDLRLQNEWTNTGTIEITGGGILTLDGAWENQGTIASTDSTVELDGMFTLAKLGTFNRSGGVVQLKGDLDNVADLTLDATTGDWEMRGGKIIGGAVMQADGSELIFTSTSGTLDGVTMDAPMNMTATSAIVRIDNGLTLNDTATLGVSGQIAFNGQTQSLDGTGDVHFSAGASQGFVNTTTGTNLTIEPGMTVRGQTGRVGSSNGSSTVTNKGTIHSDETGRIDVQSGGGWSNEGTLMASNGGEIRTLHTWSNTGTIALGESGTMDASSGLPLTGSGTLSVDIGGASSFGEIDVTGQATLAGTLDINLVGGFTPTAGQSYVIMTYDSVSGSFDTVNGTTIGGGLSFSVDVGPTTLTLNVVN
jgi:hypothetical protein